VTKIQNSLINRIKELITSKDVPRPYYKIRFRWWKPFDIEKFLKDNSEKFQIEQIKQYDEPGRIDIFKDLRNELKLKADTIYVFITPYRAIIFQKELSQLTEKDKNLVEYILTKYTHIRDTPFI